MYAYHHGFKVFVIEMLNNNPYKMKSKKKPEGQMRSIASLKRE